MQVNIHEAKTQLSALLQRVADGEEVVIARAGKPIARLVPIRRRSSRLLGVDDGRLEIPADFDAPLPEAVLKDFEG